LFAGSRKADAEATPLRAMAVTMLLAATPCAASSIALHAAIEMFRKK
jgi:hypothetical protein